MKRLVNCSRVSGMCRIAHDPIAPLATSTAAVAAAGGQTSARLFTHSHHTPRCLMRTYYKYTIPGPAVDGRHEYPLNKPKLGYGFL